MSGDPGGREATRKAIKDLILRLHSGADPEALKDEFEKAVQGVNPEDIVYAEQELVKEGILLEDIRRLCPMHIDVLDVRIEGDGQLAAPGHPVHTLMGEHDSMLEFARRLKGAAGRIMEVADASSEMDLLKHITGHFRDSERHYLREENVLFPYLERHGITGPTAVMWSEHDQIRGVKRRLYALMDGQSGMDPGEFASRLNSVATDLEDLLAAHFHKENGILFPTAMNVMTDREWDEVREGFDEIGYCCFTPETAEGPDRREMTGEGATGGRLTFATGDLLPTEIEAIMDTLPVEITFVDREDTVRYFNRSEERIFERTRAVIGRRVQNCHPQKSLHLVERVLEDLKSGKSDVSEFWIQRRGRMVHIRYFAVRRDGEYLGTLEVTQDITDIQKIQGEKRLL